MLTRTRRPNSTPADLRMGVRARAVCTSAQMRLVGISVLTAAEAGPATGGASVVAVIVASMIGKKASVRFLSLDPSDSDIRQVRTVRLREMHHNEEPNFSVRIIFRMKAH